MDSTVLVKVDNLKKYTTVKNKTDCPYFNEYFCFDIHTTPEKLLDKNITLTVLQPGRCLRKRKILGFITLDIATVWVQTDHQFYHKWAVLSAPLKDVMGGSRGYLKVDLSVLAKGQAPKIPTILLDDDDIESNLLLPLESLAERQKANFIFDIYKGEFKSENCSIEFVFAGKRVKTSTQKHTCFPTWNERLILQEFFPPLCQRLKIEIYQNAGLKKKLRAFRHVNLNAISNHKEQGFLPNFGPTFLYFYNSDGYFGKAFLRFTTEITDVSNDPNNTEVPHIDEYLLKNEQVFLFCAIFNATNITKKYTEKTVSFRITFGDILKQGDLDGISVLNDTFPQTTKKTNKYFSFLEIEENKPCLTISSFLPDFRKRMYNSNLLVKIKKGLKLRLEKIETLFSQSDYSKSEIDEILMESVDFIQSATEKYKDIVSVYNMTETTMLDQLRLKMCLNEMENICEISKQIYNSKTRRKSFSKLEKLLRRIEALSEDAQDCWPNVYLVMYHWNKKIGYATIDPKDIVFSVVSEEKGVNCGVLQTIYIKTFNEEKSVEFLDIVCKTDVILWLGLDRYKNNCFQQLPKGFKLNSENSPTALVAEEKYCRAHIFQGRFNPGYDKTGLCDPFIHVHVTGQFRETQLLRKTLNPIWDESLIFRKIVLYGAKSFIKENPPIIFMEIYDEDECCKTENVGRAVLKPLIKMVEDPYSAPLFPPKLQWFTVYNKTEACAEILGAFELLELIEAEIEEKHSKYKIVQIPADIKPILENFKVEVYFWGVRDLRKNQCIQINKPKILVQCINSILCSDSLNNAKNNLNFANPVKSLEVIFPIQAEYAPPLSLKMYDTRCFGINVYAGTHIVQMQKFFYKSLTSEERNLKFSETCSISADLKSIMSIIERSNSKEIFKVENKITESKECFLKTLCKKLCKTKRKKVDSSSVISYTKEEMSEIEDFDWWTKFYASLEETPLDFNKIPLSHQHKLKVYQSELESQPEFKGFSDILTAFHMYKGKRTGDEAVDEENITGVFKGAIRIHQWPPISDSVNISNGLPLENGFFQDFPKNKPLRFVLRVYCIRAIGLRPKDLNGKSDPYLYLNLNGKIIRDKQRVVMRNTNPIFGICYEFNGVFPQDNTLILAVYDWDLTTSDDLIGETKIDLENRFYTKHRANCGIPDHYNESGYCEWRDQQKPSQILENLCKKSSLTGPEYGETSIRVGFNEFPVPEHSDTSNKKEVLALAALRRWHEVPLVGCRLVPEHVETRSLYNPAKPGIEQGKIQLWIDILPCTDLPTPKQVEVSPRKPLKYELRVIIWNTSDIQLDEDDFFTGERKSDIYVKGWMTDPEEAQYTDVHYRSLTGEGNFNWRFIFPFQYLSDENKLVLYKKETFFASDETEIKIPCKLTLQVWDNDTFSAEDFLGVLTLELSRLPRGAKSAEKCTLSILDTNAPRVNLFKIRRTKGWWPFRSIDHETKAEVFAGSIEAELELVANEDSQKCPAGLGRDEPQALPKPNRPDTSFSWFGNPLKALKYLLKLHKWKICKCFIFILLVMIIVIAIYAFPGYTVKKILGA